MENVLLKGSKMTRRSYLLFLCTVLLFSTFHGEEKGKVGNEIPFLTALVSDLPWKGITADRGGSTGYYL